MAHNTHSDYSEVKTLAERKGKSFRLHERRCKIMTHHDKDKDCEDRVEEAKESQQQTIDKLNIDSSEAKTLKEAEEDKK